MKTIVIGIVRKDDSVLLVKRQKKEKDLLWQFPAGEIEDDETAEAAVLREIVEETGLVCSNPCPLGERVHPSTGRTALYFSVDHEGPVEFIVNDADIAEVCFQPIGALHEMITSEIFPPAMDYLSRTDSA